MTINIAAFEEILPDAEAIRSAADSFKETVSSVNQTAVTTAFAWNGINDDVYDVPGKEQVFSAFLPVMTAAGDLVEHTDTVHGATTAYAEVVDSLKARLEGVKADAASFYSEVDGRPQDEWDDDEGLVEKELGIIGALDQLYADLQAAQRECANAISGIYGGPAYVLTTEEGPAANQIAYGYSKDQLDAAAVAGDIPWGKPTEWDKPWYKDVGDGIASFGKGLWSGVTGTVTGLGNMVGLNGEEAFKQTWVGLGKLALNAAIVTSPVAQIALRATGNSDVVDKAAEELLVVGKAAVHWDEWQSDPAYAAGATTFDLASILLTAGAGATAKVGSVAGKVATVGGKAGTVVRVTGVGKVAVGTVKATNVIQGVKVSTINIASGAGRTAIGKVTDVYQAGSTAVNNTVRNGAVALNNAADRVINAVSPQPAFAGAGGVSSRPGALMNAAETHTGSRGGAGASQGSGGGSGVSSGTGGGAGSTSGTPSAQNRAEEFRRQNAGRYGAMADEQSAPSRADADSDTAAGTRPPVQAAHQPETTAAAAERPSTSGSNEPIGGATRAPASAPERPEAQRAASSETGARPESTSPSTVRTAAVAPEQAGAAGRSSGAAATDRLEATEQPSSRPETNNPRDNDARNAGGSAATNEKGSIPATGSVGQAATTPETSRTGATSPESVTGRPVVHGTGTPEPRAAEGASNPRTGAADGGAARTTVGTDAPPADRIGAQAADSDQAPEESSQAEARPTRSEEGTTLDDPAAHTVSDRDAQGHLPAPDGRAYFGGNSTLTEDRWDDNPPKVEFDDAGNPVKLVFSDGDHHIAYSNDRLEEGARDIMQHVSPVLQRHGRTLEWLQDMVQREATDLSVLDAEALFDIRRSIPDLTPGSAMQKITTPDQGDSLFSPDNKRSKTAFGFITDASDTRDLLTPTEIFRALRLDYDTTDFLDNDSTPVRAVRFSSDAADLALVPDEALVQNLQRHGVDVFQDALEGRPSAKGGDQYPNTGHGFTASTSDRTPIVTEYKITTPMLMRKGAEMWEMTGDRVPVLVGVFDGANWRRIDMNSVPGPS